VVRRLTDFTLTKLLVHEVGFLVKRWAQKIMSFVISASRLFALTQSTRLRNVILGNLSIKILTSPPAAPYTCNLSSEAIRALLDRLITDERAEDYEETRESFIDQLKKKKALDQVCQYKPTVHAELAMVMAMVNEDITHVLPYIGVSKLSCIMCSHYIRAFNQVMGQKIAVRGSHGKAYPGWSWPVSPGRNEELRVAFLKRIREQLRNDFEDYAERHRRRSDSTVGSSGPSVKLGATDDEISEAFARRWGMAVVM
jgi:OTT_1508-like deaminase